MFENLWNLACMASGTTRLADYEVDDRLAFSVNGRDFAICAEIAGDKVRTGYMVRISISEFNKEGEVAHFLSQGFSMSEMGAFSSCKEAILNNRNKLYQLIEEQVGWDVVAEDLFWEGDDNE